MDRGKNHHNMWASWDNNDEANVSDKEMKNIIRRETERQRRLHMTTLCQSLRSLLPSELIKGKRSVSDHIGEAANYIKDLEEKTQKLQIKRDKLRNEANYSSLVGAGIECSNHSNMVKCVRFSPFLGGLEISIDSGSEESSLPLSLLLEILIQEGCNVVSCVSSQVNGRLYHSIKTEVGNLGCLDLAGLKQKLNDAILWSRYYNSSPSSEFSM